MKKLLFTFVLALLATVSVWAQTFTADNLTYKVTDAAAKTVELTGYETEPTGALTIPATVTNGGTTYSVTAIGESAFRECRALTSVTIPDGVTEIQDCTFAFCSSLKSVTIGSGVTSIGEQAFYLCSGITEMTVAATVPPTMVTNAFTGVSQSIPVYVPLEALDAYKAADGWKEFSGLQAKGFSSFTVDNLNYRVTGSTAVELTGYVTKPTGILDIPATVSYEGKNFDVTAIGKGAFGSCSGITLLTIPNTVKTIGVNAFYSCSGILELTIPDSVTKIGNYAFSYCDGIKQLTIGNGVTSIGFHAFHGCSALTAVTIPDGVTEIQEYTFAYCYSLKSVTIGKGVTGINLYAFGWSDNISELTVDATVPPTVEENAFHRVSKNISVYVPMESLAAYQAADVWKEFTNLQAISSGLDTPSMPESISVYGGMLRNPEGLALCIYDLTGRIVYSGNATTLSLTAGVYVVRCNGAIGKIMF